MVRVVLIPIGVVLVLIGLVLFPLPIPLGAILIASGMSILIACSRRVRRWVRDWRSTNPWLQRTMQTAEQRLPKTISRLLQSTNPTLRNGPPNPGSTS